MKKLSYYLVCIACALLTSTSSVFAGDEKGFSGAFVDDPNSLVQPGAYFAISSVYNGRRYYLGVDTVAAQAPTNKDTVTWYEGPNYATIWIAGPLWSPTGEILADKNYSRTVKSVWLAERVSRERYLALGSETGTYRSLRLLADGALWYTEKDSRERNRYINGYLYYYSPATETGVEVYRYLSFDPVYGFSRLREAKSASQRITIWDRKTGSDLQFHIDPPTYTFGYSTTAETLPITSQVYYYENVDRFRSRYDQVDVYAQRTEPVTDQKALLDPPYSLSGYYEWKSNPIVGAPADYNGNSLMQYYTITSYDYTDPLNPVPVWGWRDTALIHVSQTNFVLDEVDNVWKDAIFAVGPSPVDDPSDARFLRKPAGGGAPTEGDYVNHSDWLYIHFTCKGNNYKDSALVVRQTFHQEHYTTLEIASSPEDAVYPYTYNNKLYDETTSITPSDTAKTFTISALYKSGSQTLSPSGNVVYSEEGTKVALDLLSRVPVIDEGVLYNGLEVEALNADGTPCEWIESVWLPARNEIRVKVKQYNPDATSNRFAQIRFTYRYRNVVDESDIAIATRSIWISQEWKDAHATETYIYSFTHKDTEADGLQAVHEKKNTMYAIPGEPMSLPLHRDHWGYYRWFIYDTGSKKDRDLQYMNTWSYATGYAPKNSLNVDNDFMLINHSSAASSRGRWDVIKDIEHPGNPIFAQDHFIQWRRTPIPAVIYPEKEAASLTRHGKVACDVSAYYDIQTTAATGVGVDLTALTEPTLSYRQVIDIQPAKTRADQMAAVKGNGNGANWLEKYKVVAPAGRAFSLQPQCPISAVGADDIDTVHLQYIYYANPVDANAGTRTGLTDEDLQNNQYYARVGVKKRVNTYKKLTLITYADLMALGNNGSISDILLVNPRNATGLIVGNNNEQAPWYMDYRPYRATKTQLEDDLAAKLNDGGGYAQAYLTIQRNGSTNQFIFKRGNYKLFDLFTLIDIGGGVWRDYNVRWYNGNPTGSEYFTLGSYAGSLSDANLPSGYSSGDLVTLYTNWEEYIVFVKKSNKGYLRGEYPIYCADVNEAASRNPYFGWLIYKVETVSTKDYQEIPRWEKSADGITWNPADSVAVWNYKTNTAICKEGYSMTADGVLHINHLQHTTANRLVYYRLRTQHFQLAQFAVVIRNAQDEILRVGGDIISEEEVERDYDILYKLDMEDWAAPGTTDVVAYNQPFDWDFTELSYHYPLSAIPAEKRVFTTEMPGKGEYAFINKFVVPEGPTTQNPGMEYECMDGAEHGYMLCVNAAGKRTTIMNFDFNQITCSNQQIYLVGNYCNPVNNSFNPQITADLEGSNDGGNTWTLIYRYKSGEIPYRANNDHPWHQMALPIARDSIAKYQKFRCRAEINGGSQQNAHLLIDRLRFIEKDRAFSVFQNKATCVKEDSVVALIRINYQSDPDLYQPGKLIAYQFQMWKDSANGGTGGYVPMLASKSDGAGGYIALDDNTEPQLQVFPGYLKDGFTAKESVEKPFLKSLKGNDYGYVLIPEADYDPSASGASSGQSALRGALIDQALTKLGITGAAAAERKANFLNETSNIRTFDQIVSSDYNDWGVVEFGQIKTAHIKSFVNVDGTWLLYIVCRLPVDQTDNNTFRIGMTVMNNLNDKPTFADESCATFRILKVKQTTSLLLDGEEWPNYSREEIEASPSDDKELLPSNETYRASIKLTVKNTVGTYPTYNPRCKFDLLHAADSVRPNTAAGNLAFERRYGCTRTQFIDDMEAFRTDDERNVMRDIADWDQVTPEMFTHTGRTPAVATAIYNRLNHLIKDLHVLELGLDYRDIYMGDKADSWFYLIPIPATGLFDVNRSHYSSLPDTTMSASVCNDTLWLQLHSLEPQAKLRFGYDSRVGDTYVVPVIRASRSEANGEDGKHLNVRIAESWSEPAYTVVIGMDSTELIDSNDPDWTKMKTFKYHQDKDMNGHKPSEYSDYYAKGDIVQFTPVAGNDIALKAGYWYQFRTAFFAALSADTYTADPVHATGHTQFILAIAPDTVRWTPAHPDVANYWNDDHNWTPLMRHVPEDGFKATVPMKDTKVIIPEVEEGLSPIASDYVENQIDTLHYGYAKNTCNAILFKPNAEILGQEKLTYERAYVDIPLKTGSWQTFSPAIDDVYAGDMYIPFSASYDPANPASGASTDNEDFAPKPFPCKAGYSGTYNPRVYPFAFYQGFYNSSVPVAFYNTDEEGTPVATTMVQSKSSVDWVKTNALDMYYAPGKACVLTGYDATDEDGRPIVVRLPKPDDAYYGFGKNGGTNYVAGSAVTISRPNKMNRNLAYDKYAPSFSETEGLTYTLTNATESEIFFFGNPTMSLIDVYRLCVANEGVLKHEAGSYNFTAYNLIDGDNYTVRTITGPGQFFVAPQHAVGLIANATQTAAKSLPIKLTPSALVAITGDGHLVSGDEVAKPMPRRAHNDEEAINPRRLYIAAANETDWGIKKAYLTLGVQENATCGYRYGEDALSIVSGLNYFSDESYNTPLSMYTIADNQALMMDIRDTLNMIPLIFTTLDDNYTFSNHTLLSFAMSGQWTAPLFLHEAVTGDSIQIRNGMQIAIVTPLSDQLRYFINGGGSSTIPVVTPDDPGVVTNVENINGETNSPLNNNHSTIIYDMLGRRVKVLGKYELINNVQLPTGVYIIQRGQQTERMVIR